MLKEIFLYFFTSGRDVLYESALITYCMILRKRVFFCVYKIHYFGTFTKWLALQRSPPTKSYRTLIFTVYNLFGMYFIKSSDDRMGHMINQPLDHKTNRSLIVLQTKIHVLLPNTVSLEI